MKMDKTCSEIGKYLSGYIDGALTSDMAWKIDMHCATCRNCAQTIQQLRKTVSLLAQVQPKPMSENFDSKLAAKIAALDMKAPHRRSAAQTLWDRVIFGITSSRREIKLRIGFAAAAASLVFVGVLTPHSLLQPDKTIKGTIKSAAALPAMDTQDADFIAACANDQNQTSDTQSLVDPAAQTLAARFDASVVSSSQPAAANTARQD
jgi:hypothetical protein